MQGNAGTPRFIPTHSLPRSPSSAFTLFLGEGSPTKIDYRKRSGPVIPTSLLEDLATSRPKLNPATWAFLG